MYKVAMVHTRTGPTSAAAHPATFLANPDIDTATDTDMDTKTDTDTETEMDTSAGTPTTFIPPVPFAQQQPPPPLRPPSSQPLPLPLALPLPLQPPSLPPLPRPLSSLPQPAPPALFASLLPPPQPWPQPPIVPANHKTVREWQRRSSVCLSPVFRHALWPTQTSEGSKSKPYIWQQPLHIDTHAASPCTRARHTHRITGRQQRQARHLLRLLLSRCNLLNLFPRCLFLCSLLRSRLQTNTVSLHGQVRDGARSNG